MRLAALAGVALGLMALGRPARAQDGPPALPTRDVDVLYRSTRGGESMEQRSRFDLALQRLRLDTPTPGLYMIVDYRARVMSMVSEPERGVVDLPVPPGLMPGQAAAGRFVRRGQDQVAGVPCTEWEAKDSQGLPATTCFTGDGVMLRARRGTLVLAQAVRVAYGPLDPAVFSVPAGYHRVERRP